MISDRLVLMLSVVFVTLLNQSAMAGLEQRHFDQINQMPKAYEVGFIIPNEDHFYLFNSDLEAKGRGNALIGVGTFRFFHDASVGQFSYAISLDHSIQVSRFNQGLINLIKASDSRKHFIANLFGTDQFKLVLQRFESGFLSEERFKEIAERQIYQYQQENLKNQAQILRFFPASVAPEDLRAFSSKILEFILSPEKGNATFLGSDKLFRNLKSLADLNRIFIVNGSITSGPAIETIARRLRENSSKVSVINISNIHSGLYIQDYEVEKYLKNISQLPFSPDASVLVTQANSFSKRTAEGLWSYHVVPVHEYLKVSGDPFFELLQSGKYQIRFKNFCAKVFAD